MSSPSAQDAPAGRIEPVERTPSVVAGASGSGESPVSSAQSSVTTGEVTAAVPAGEAVRPPGAAERSPGEAVPSSGEAGRSSGVESPEASADAVRGRRLTGSWSLVGQAAFVLALAAVTLLLLPRPNGVTQPRVDPVAATERAAATLHFMPALPRGLDLTWVPTGAGVRTSDGGHKGWFVAYRTPSGGWVGVNQAARPDAVWEVGVGSPGHSEAPLAIGAHLWSRRFNPEMQVTTLVLRQGNRDTVVAGRAPIDELEELIQHMPLEVL